MITVVLEVRSLWESLGNAARAMETGCGARNGDSIAIAVASRCDGKSTRALDLNSVTD